MFRFPQEFRLRVRWRETGHDVVLVDACVDFPLDCRPEEVFEKALPIENHAIGAAAPCVERFFDRASGFFGKNVLEICKSADIVFNALHGDEGRKRQIAGSVQTF